MKPKLQNEVSYKFRGNRQHLSDGIREKRSSQVARLHGKQVEL